MKYNFANYEEYNKALDYVNELGQKEAIVEIKKVSPSRSLNQNSYLHLLLGEFGNHFGYTIEEAKLIYKEINKTIYYYKKKDRLFIRSSADLSVDEMTKTIDYFRQKSAEQGCELPPATDKEWLRSIENTIEQSRYL